MKISIYLTILFSMLFTIACEKEMKEHPLPESLKKKLLKKSDPELKAKEIHGTITVEKELAESVPAGAKLFIFARQDGVEGGPPLAVRRHSLVEFPFQYTIGPADVMIEGNRFEGAVRITARLDQDGNAKPTPGDIEGARVAQAGDKKVDILLDKVIEGSAKKVTGTIRVAPELAKSLPEEWKLFVVARARGVDQGPPLAVKLLHNVEFPYQFTLGQEDAMLPGAVFDGAMTIIARIDSDGNAVASAGDIEGDKPAQAGDSGVEVVMDRKVGG